MRVLLTVLTCPKRRTKFVAYDWFHMFKGYDYDDLYDFLSFHSVAVDEEIHLHNLRKGDVPINVEARWQQGSKFHGLIQYCLAQS